MSQERLTLREINEVLTCPLNFVPHVKLFLLKQRPVYHSLENLFG